MKRVIAVLLLLGLVGCAEVSPFVDTRREAGQVEPVGQSRPDKIAVCYHAWWHDMTTVQALAEAECAKQGKKAELVETTYFNCRLMTPTTAFYACR